MRDVKTSASRRQYTVSLLSGLVLVLSLIGYPLLAPISVLLEVPNRLVSIPFRLVVAVSAAIVIALRASAPRMIRVHPLWVIWWAFWALYIYRILIDGILNHEALRLPFVEYISFAVGISLLPATAISIGIDLRMLRGALGWIILLGSVACIFNVIIILRMGLDGGISGLIAARQMTDTLNPISLGHLGVSVALLSSWSLIRGRPRGGWLNAFLLFAFSIGIGTSVLAASRGPLLCFIVIFPLMLLSGIKSTRASKLLPIAVLTLGCAAALLAIWANRESIAAASRIELALSGESIQSIDQRIDLLAAGLSLFFKSPLLGAGTEPLGMYPHNVLIESFLSFGLASGLTFCILFFGSLLRAMRIVIANGEGSWVSYLLLQYFIGGMLSGAIYGNGAMWCLMAVVLGGGIFRSARVAVAVYPTPRPSGQRTICQ